MITHQPVAETQQSSRKGLFFNGKNKSGGFFAPVVQPKLTVNEPGDEYEQEADAVADRVMRMPDMSSSAGGEGEDKPAAAAGTFLQRKPIPITPIQRKCSDCAKGDDDEKMVQSKETSGSDAGGKAAPSIVSDVLSSGGGQAMDGGTRQFMESRFGQDFSSVRIHTGSRAAESAGAIQARAYTSGRDVVFGAGEYQPGSEGGRRLLAHELVHVGQQGKIQVNIQRDFTLKPLNQSYTPITLTPPDEAQAVKFNDKFKFNKNELIYFTDLFGRKNTIDGTDKLGKKLANDIVRYQQQYNITPNGKIEYSTARLLIKEIENETGTQGTQTDKTGEKIIQKLSAHYASPVLYVGMNSYDEEIKGLKSNLRYHDKGQLSTVTGGHKPDAVESDGVTYDLTKDAGIEAFIKGLNISDKTTESKAIDYLKRKKLRDSSNVDENAFLLKEYSIADRGYADRMTRLVLSGHSGGTAISGKGVIVFKDLIELKALFPQAASQVLHLMVSACTAGTQDNIEDTFVKAFPNLRTVWGYYGSCPMPANADIVSWEKDTSGYDSHKLKRQGGGGISIWNEGIYTGSGGISKIDAIAAVDNNENIYLEYFKGNKMDKDAYSGELYQYYNTLRGLLGRSDLTADEKKKYSARRDQSVRLRFYHKVAEKHSKVFNKILSEGYGTAALPDYAILDRKQAWQKILDFDSDAKGNEAKKKEAKNNLETCLRDLSPVCIPEDWIN